MELFVTDITLAVSELKRDLKFAVKFVEIMVMFIDVMETSVWSAVLLQKYRFSKELDIPLLSLGYKYIKAPLLEVKLFEDIFIKDFVGSNTNNAF